MRRVRTYSVKEVNWALELYQDQRTCRQVADITGFPAGTISGWTRRYGVARRQGDNIRIALLTKYAERHARIASLYDAGFPAEKVAELTGVCAQTVYNVLRTRGRLRRPGTRSLHDQMRRERRNREIWRHHAEGVSTEDIAARYGLSVSYTKELIRQEKKLLGVEFRRAA